MTAPAYAGEEAVRQPGGCVDPPPSAAWRLARATLSMVLCGYGVIALFTVWQSGAGPGDKALAVALLVALLSIQLCHFSRPGAPLRSPLGYALLAAQAVLGYLPLLLFGQAWVGMPGFFAGCALLVLPRPGAWTAFGLVVASMGCVQAALDHVTLDALYTAVGVALYGLDVYLLTYLAATVAQLYAARTELARMAVAHERSRFSRDLHDLLGLSLSGIALKSELAHRLMLKRPDRARDQLIEIADVAGRALSEVRLVADGYQELSLEQELRFAESVLVAANIELCTRLDRGELPNAVNTVLGMVLREAVTNVVRHSKAERCDIVVRHTADEVCLAIRNDGVDQRSDGPAPAGSGIRNLTDRVARLGGTITAERRDDGRFLVESRIPLDAVPGGDDRPTDPPAEAADAAPVPGMTKLPIGESATHRLVVVVLAGLWLSAVLHVFYFAEPVWQRAATIGCLTALLALQIACYLRVSRLRPRLGYALLIGQAAVVYLPLFALREDWVSLPGFLAGTALLVLRPVPGFALFTAIVGGEVLWWRFGASIGPLDIAFNAVATAASGLVVFGLISQAKLVDELHDMRARLAAMAVGRERFAFANELQGLLGLRLAAIAVKSNIACGLSVTAPAKAASEIGEIQALARQSLSDVRSVARGYRESSLDNEARSAESVLVAADVAVQLRVSCRELPVLPRTVLATALREGVTNVLRHSTAEHCRITISQSPGKASLYIANDGVGAPPWLQPTRDPGIGELSERVARLGGVLDTRVTSDGWFAMVVTVPA